MQRTGGRSQEPNDVKGTFADRAKSARLRAGLTQQQLAHRLEAEADVSLDTSGITRIEAGQREPRLSEALALARVLKFDLDDLTPRADLDFYLTDVKRLMAESRAALVKMLRSVESVVDLVRQNPDTLGDEGLDDRFRDLVEQFHRRASPKGFQDQDPKTLAFAITTNRTDERLKRQLLRAVSDGILVRPDELQPAYDRWFNENLGEDRRAGRKTSTTAKTIRGRKRVESRTDAKR
ncbi:helix-turn-helix transcriptional regulator [Mycobacterium sp. 1165178.9]|uniref:helix-turn-helix domain-containing protein n=1 Tax=Mycobacterium sp. 1165178.9 TaxID=1834070 RepID=UPI000A3E17BE|nr:helix-turn-helix transcriptional regulator [Mycobacterium sp. 1165178.9]